MTTDPDTAQQAEPGNPSGVDLAERNARTWAVGTVVVVAVLVIWFFVSWLAMGRLAVDAAGESIGSGLVLLLVATLISALRGDHSR